MRRRFRALRIPKLKGGGGPTNVKAPLAVFEILWNFLRIVSFIITKRMKGIICFV